jgi:hypothetical protein
MNKFFQFYFEVNLVARACSGLQQGKPSEGSTHFRLFSIRESPQHMGLVWVTAALHFVPRNDSLPQASVSRLQIRNCSRLLKSNKYGLMD